MINYEFRYNILQQTKNNSFVYITYHTCIKVNNIFMYTAKWYFYKQPRRRWNAVRRVIWGQQNYDTFTLTKSAIQRTALVCPICKISTHVSSVSSAIINRISTVVNSSLCVGAIRGSIGLVHFCWNRNNHLLLLPLLGFCFRSMFCCAKHWVLLSFAFILMEKRELNALFCLSFCCLVSVNVLWLSLTLLWVGLQCVLVVFPDHTHFRNKIYLSCLWNFGIIA